MVSLADEFANKDVSKSLDELSSKLLALQETTKIAKAETQLLLEQARKKEDEMKDKNDHLRGGLNRVLDRYEEQLNAQQLPVIDAITTAISSYDTLIS